MPTLSSEKLYVGRIGVAGGVLLSAAATTELLKPGNEVSGDATFTTPGTFIFIVPAGVRKISAVAVGAGGGGHPSWSYSGGGGGGLAWANNIDVTPGQQITIVVPDSPAQITAGGTALVGTFFSATGGQPSNISTGGTFVSGTVQCSGGRGGSGRGGSSGGGGGGAGGYSGNGGNGYYGTTGISPYNGDGGGAAGGGGYGSSTYGFAGGGGVGLTGRGTSGTWGALANQASSPSDNGNSFYSDLRYSGAGGSGGENGAPNSNGSTTSNLGRTQYSGEGGRYGGGGGGGGTSLSGTASFCRGAQGAVRIVWSTSPSYSIAGF